MGLGAFACGVAGTLERLRWALVPLPAGFKVPKRHFEGFGVLVGFGAFDGWQTAGFNAKKKLLGWAMGFGAFACGVRGPKMHLEGLEFL